MIIRQCLDGPQLTNGVETKTPIGIAPDHSLKSLDDGIAIQGRSTFFHGKLYQFSHGNVASRHVLAVQKQVQPLIHGFFKLDFHDPGLFHIQVDHFGRSGQAKNKMIVALRFQLNHFLFMVDFKFHFTLKITDLWVSSRTVFLLNLFDAQAILFGLGIIHTAYLKNGMPGFVDPLVKKPL